jgi:hypothetical protein
MMMMTAIMMTATVRILNLLFLLSIVSLVIESGNNLNISNS